MNVRYEQFQDCYMERWREKDGEYIFYIGKKIINDIKQERGQERIKLLHILRDIGKLGNNMKKVFELHFPEINNQILEITDAIKEIHNADVTIKYEFKDSISLSFFKLIIIVTLSKEN